MTREYSVAILGATGAVGTRLIEQLEQSTIPVKNIKLLASSRSAGKTLQFSTICTRSCETRRCGC